MENETLNEIEKKRVLRRLKKILALTDSSEPGEAAAALHQARVLMNKYGLEATDAQASTIEEAELEMAGADVSRWEGALAGVITTALGVSVLVRRYKRQRGFKSPKATIIFVAQSHKAQIAKYAFEILRRKLRQAMRQSFEQMLVGAGVDPASMKINSHQRDAYAMAWCEAICSKVEALAPKVESEVASYVEKKITPGVESEKRRSKKADPFKDPLAKYMYHYGSEDGAKVELHNAVNGSLMPQQLLA